MCRSGVINFNWIVCDIMSNFVKCRICHKKIDKSTAYNPKPRMYYCSKDEYDASRVKKTPQSDDSKQLVAYIASIYGADMNYPFILNQLKYLRKTYNYKNKGMLLTLQYVQNVKHEKIDTRYGVSHVITRFYINAKKYYIKNMEQKKKILEFNFKDECSTITVNQGSNKKLKNKIKAEEF